MTNKKQLQLKASTPLAEPTAAEVAATFDGCEPTDFELPVAHLVQPVQVGLYPGAGPGDWVACCSESACSGSACTSPAIPTPVSFNVPLELTNRLSGLSDPCTKPWA